ncbi:MAG TPA: ferrochelatase [Acidimicrobiales bacterium]|jgi:ferrochelatase|nr:ferrochelatase [Acidimicrobiales bacterium]
MTTGVLLMAHGTPASTAEIEPFYTRIRRGRPPTPEQLAELEGRYAAIGGVSPLAVRTAAQVDAVRRALDARAPGRYVVTFGAKHTDPLIEESAAFLGAAGLERVVGLVLTPHGSSMGSEEYLGRAVASLGSTPFVPVAPWYAEPALVALLAARVQDALRNVAGRTRVIFTAHSLPERIRETGDTYPEQLSESARMVAEAAGLDDWLVAWQSAGRTPEPWIGPDVRDVVRQLAADDDADAVVVCPIGFVADHLEVLYDLDVDLVRVATAAGVAYARTASLNDDPSFIATLTDLIVAADEAP